MYKRKDGLYADETYINGIRKAFTGKSPAKVKAKMAAFEASMKNGRLFTDVANEWSEEHERKSSYNAHRAYNVPYATAIEYFSGLYIKSITTPELDVFIKRVAAKGFALRTVKGYISLLNLIFIHAIIKGDITSNPAQYVEPPKGLITNSRELPDAATIKAISDNVNATYGMLPFFLLYTGCRRGEVLALQYQDIDFEKNIIYIKKSIYFEGNTPYIKEPKTKAGFRQVPLLNRLKTELISYMKKQGIKNADYYIFGDKNKIPTLSMFTRRWESFSKSTNIKVTPHQLRHLFATVLYEQDIDEKLAQEILGHSSYKMTKDLYTHIRQSKMTDALEKLNAYKIE